MGRGSVTILVVKSMHLPLAVDVGIMMLLQDLKSIRNTAVLQIQSVLLDYTLCPVGHTTEKRPLPNLSKTHSLTAISRLWYQIDSVLPWRSSYTSVKCSPAALRLRDKSSIEPFCCLLFDLV